MPWLNANAALILVSFSGQADRVLVIGSETFRKIHGLGRAAPAVLFGDGAGGDHCSKARLAKATSMTAVSCSMRPETLNGRYTKIYCNVRRRHQPRAPPAYLRMPWESGVPPTR